MPTKTAVYLSFILICLCSSPKSTSNFCGTLVLTVWAYFRIERWEGEVLWLFSAVMLSVLSDGLDLTVLTSKPHFFLNRKRRNTFLLRGSFVTVVLVNILSAYTSVNKYFELSIISYKIIKIFEVIRIVFMSQKMCQVSMKHPVLKTNFWNFTRAVC